ncbi:MAG: aminotransferase class IV [Roseivirga sp.]|nr:aminotransferase class IV [Roseivirga sp.]
MKAIYNSRILPEEEIDLHIRNRAFCYGDGLFETIVTGPDRINLLALHIARLSKACAVLNLVIPFNQQELEEQIDQLKTANELTGQLRILIQVWREEGGLYQPSENQSAYLITIAKSNSPFYSGIERLSVSAQAKLNWHALSFAKTMSALPYVLAGVERGQRSSDDLIICDGQGNIAECVASNIFWVKDKEVYTPDLNSGCVNGTMRQHLISQLKVADLQVHEVMQSPEQLHAADHVFLSNTSGIQWVQQFEDKTLYSDPKDLLALAAILPPQL